MKMSKISNSSKKLINDKFTTCLICFDIINENDFNNHVKKCKNLELDLNGSIYDNPSNSYKKCRFCKGYFHIKEFIKHIEECEFYINKAYFKCDSCSGYFYLFEYKLHVKICRINNIKNSKENGDKIKNLNSQNNVIFSKMMHDAIFDIFNISKNANFHESIIIDENLDNNQNNRLDKDSTLNSDNNNNLNSHNSHNSQIITPLSTNGIKDNISDLIIDLLINNDNNTNVNDNINKIRHERKIKLLSIKSFNYSTLKLKEEDSNNCNICYFELNDCIIDCKKCFKLFHYNCLYKWLIDLKKDNCPFCNYNMIIN